MDNYPFSSNLFLSVKRSGLTRIDDPNADEADAEFKIQKQKFFQQLDHSDGLGNRSCECCGFNSKSFQHIHHKDGNHQNNSTSNYSMRCPLCHYVEHIGYELVAENAVIIMLPEMSQELLNNTLIHGFALNYLVENNIDESSNDYENIFMMATQFNALYGALNERSFKTKKFFGNNHPNFFANCLLDMSDDDYKNRTTSAFKDLKILFRPELFEKEIPFWANNNFDKSGEYPTEWILQCVRIKDRK